MRAIYGIALLAVVLAVVGAAYAAWTEQLQIYTKVQTGELDVAFNPNSLSVSDQGADPQAPGYSNPQGYDVASASLQVSAQDDEGDAIKLDFIVSNAYPGYTACAYFNIDNVGTIPAKLASIDFDQQPDALTISHNMTVGDIIEVGGSKPYKLCITVNDNAQEQSTYEFTVTLTFEQWNVGSSSSGG